MPLELDQLVVDQSGATPRYVTLHNGRLLLASSVADLLPEAKTLTVDLNGVAQMIAGSGPIGGRTLFKEVHRVQPGEAISCEQGRIRKALDWEWENITPKTRDPSDLFEAIAAEVELVASSQQVVSMLSGGWDSRLLLALAARRQVASDIRALTTSSDTGTVMEELVAAQVAQILGIDHEIMMPFRHDFSEDFSTFAQAVDFQTAFHVWLVPLVRRLAEIYPGSRDAVVLDGLGGGLFVGGAFADPTGPRSLLDKRLSGTTRYLDGAERVLQRVVIGRLRESIETDASEIIRRHLDHPHGHILSAYLTRTVPGISLAPHALVRQTMMVSTPFVSTNVVRAGLSLSPADHAGDRLYPLLMARVDAQLAELATAQSQVPWPRPHPRRIASVEAIRYLRSVIVTDRLAPILAPALREGGPSYWRKLLSTTNGQHLLRGLAMFSLWWSHHQDDVAEFDLGAWLR